MSSAVSSPSSRASGAATGAEAIARQAVIDAFLRFGAGTDEGNPTLLGSAFTIKAEVDFGPCGEKLGMPFDPLVESEAIVGFSRGTSVRQVTSHVITNPRVSFAGERAHLRALVDATHIAREDRTRRFRMMNWYDTELEPEGEHWRIAHMTIDNIWFEGDLTVLGLRRAVAS